MNFERTRGLSRTGWLTTVLTALLTLFLFYTYLSRDLDSHIPPPGIPPDFAAVEVMLDESYLSLTLGDVESALEQLEELKVYCEMSDQEVPKEAEELYDLALEEWLVLSTDTDLLESE